MSRVFTDASLLTWEAFTSAGPFGMPQNANIVFQCLSDPNRRARYVQQEGNAAGAERTVRELSDRALAELLLTTEELP
jgi:hypothetical protein